MDFFGLLFFVIVVVVFWAVITYNKLVSKRERVRESWSGVDVQLKRRSNVTGNQWAFPIDRATATIRLPQGIPPTGITGYTGTTGAKGENYRVLQGDRSTIRLATTAPLAPGEGLTVAVFWTAGGVDRPGPAESTTALLSDNAGPAFGFLLFLVMTVYFFVVWRRVGRDPEKGPIIARFHPLGGMSPVAVGFVWHGGFSGGGGGGGW